MNLVVAGTQSTRDNVHNGRDDDGSKLVVVADTLTANYGKQVDSRDSNQGPPNLIAYGGNNTAGERDVASALTAHPTGRYDFESETFVAAIALSNRGRAGDTFETLRSASHGALPMVAGALGSSQGGADDNSVQALHVVGVSAGVRRLTPTEAERLQGFPDGWTADQPDSTRYRQLGNAVAVPVAAWIGR